MREGFKVEYIVLLELTAFVLRQFGEFFHLSHKKQLSVCKSGQALYVF